MNSRAKWHRQHVSRETLFMAAIWCCVIELTLVLLLVVEVVVVRGEEAVVIVVELLAEEWFGLFWSCSPENVFFFVKLFVLIDTLIIFKINLAK